MALMKCPECFGNCSDKATACPHCGFPIQSSKPDDKARLIDTMVDLCDNLVSGRDKGISKLLAVSALADSDMDGPLKEVAASIINFVYDPPQLGRAVSCTKIREELQKLLS